MELHHKLIGEIELRPGATVKRLPFDSLSPSLATYLSQYLIALIFFNSEQ